MTVKTNIFSAIVHCSRLLVIILSVFGFEICAEAQPSNAASLDDIPALRTFIDSIFRLEMLRNNLPGAAIAIVKDGKIIFTQGYGYANLDSKTPVDPEHTIFRIGSVTKVFTAVAVLQLAQKNKLELSNDVNNYLQTFKVPATFSMPVNIEHLLTHSAGFDEISKGRMVAAEKQLTPLGDFLKDRMIRNRPPGQVSSYSTYGISLAGYIVEQISRHSLHDYFRKNIFRPLQMSSTNIGTPNGEQQRRMATGYAFSKKAGYTSLPFVWFNTYPASDINSTVTDMGHFMIALLNGGKYEQGRILKKAMQENMLTLHHTNYPGVPGWTYGLQESRKINGQRGLEHGGSMDDGFSSLLYLLPDHHIGIFITGTLESTNLYDVVKESFVKHYFPLQEKIAIAESPADLKKDLSRFEGMYQWEPYCHSCTNASAQSFKISATSTGRLSFFGGEWNQVKPLLFQLSDGVLAGQVYVAFREDRSGTITHMFLGGPWTYEKVPLK